MSTAPGLTTFDSGQVYSPERGEFVSQKHMDLASIIHDYNPNFELVYIPKSEQTAFNVKPFAIRDNTPGKPPYIMRSLTMLEMNNPAEILAWIFAGDLSKHRPIDVMKRIELQENAEKLLTMRRHEEELLDQAEIMSTIMVGGRNQKNYFRHNGRTYRR